MRRFYRVKAQRGKLTDEILEENMYPGLDLADPQVVKWANSSRQEFFGMLLPIAYAAMVAAPSPT